MLKEIYINCKLIIKIFQKLVIYLLFIFFYNLCCRKQRPICVARSLVLSYMVLGLAPQCDTKCFLL
uniref:Uncharacterized protein n=1 Tax=Octopus bimaculoides TaxID=37653 RepID=A0A0L8HUI9_OCTBM